MKETYPVGSCYIFLDIPGHDYAVTGSQHIGIAVYSQTGAITQGQTSNICVTAWSVKAGQSTHRHKSIVLYHTWPTLGVQHRKIWTHAVWKQPCRCHSDNLSTSQLFLCYRYRILSAYNICTVYIQICKLWWYVNEVQS